MFALEAYGQDIVVADALSREMIWVRPALLEMIAHT
jgi:hypothetical protein